MLFRSLGVVVLVTLVLEELLMQSHREIFVLLVALHDHPHRVMGDSALPVRVVSSFHYRTDSMTRIEMLDDTCLQISSEVTFVLHSSIILIVKNYERSLSRFGHWLNSFFVDAHVDDAVQHYFVVAARVPARSRGLLALERHGCHAFSVEETCFLFSSIG